MGFAQCECKIHKFIVPLVLEELEMECLKGKTLRDMLGCRTLSIMQVLDTAIQIAEGLNAAHISSLDNPLIVL